MEQKINDIINDADMILVGIGTEMAAKCPELEGEEALFPFYCSQYLDNLPADHELIQAYNRVRELVGAKPYFVVTLNTDDLVWKSKLEHDLIVAPCGSMGKMQCTEHISEAKEIRERVLTDLIEEHKEQGVTIVSGGHPEQALCPLCGAPLQFHTIEHEGYLEEGYLPQWNKYTRWLSCTLNRKLVILELGADFKFPQVMRWPFEKTVMYNRKATLIRVGTRFPQLPEELAEKGISVMQDPVEFLLGV